MINNCFYCINHLENSTPPLILFNQTRRDYLNSYARSSLPYLPPMINNSFYCINHLENPTPPLTLFKQDAIRFIYAPYETFLMIDNNYNLTSAQFILCNNLVNSEKATCPCSVLYPFDILFQSRFIYVLLC